MAAHGVDTGPYTFPYVAAWAHPLAAVDHTPLTDVVARTGTRVIQAAHDDPRGGARHRRRAIRPVPA